VYSVDDSASLEVVKEMKAKIECYDFTDGKKRTVVLVGNKCDCVETREVTWDEGQHLAEEWGCPFMEVSGKDMINVLECFHEAVRVINEAKAESVSCDQVLPRKRKWKLRLYKLLKKVWRTFTSPLLHKPVSTAC